MENVAWNFVFNFIVVNMLVLLLFCSAHVMPKNQLHQQLETELGDDWQSKFREFDDVPIAAASIGQVLLWVLVVAECSINIYLLLGLPFCLIV